MRGDRGTTEKSGDLHGQAGWPKNPGELSAKGIPIHDNTERTQAEEALKKALEESRQR